VQICKVIIRQKAASDGKNGNTSGSFRERLVDKDPDAGVESVQFNKDILGGNPDADL
jgi:hypothetical protein